MMETPSVDHSLIVRIAVPAVGAGSTLQCKVPDAKMAEVCDLITATSKKLHEQLEAIGSTFEDETLTDLKEDITTKTAAWKGEVHSTKTATTTSSVEDTSTVKVESYSESELPENAARMVELAIQQASTEFKSKYGQAVANHSRQMSEAQKELERCHRRCRFVMAKLNIQQSDAEIDAAIDSGSHWTRAKVAILMLRNSAKLWTQLRGTPKKIHAETRIPREDLQGGLLSRRGVFGYRKLTKGVQAGRDFSGVFKNSGMRLELPPGSPRPPPAIPPPKEPLPTIPLLKISGDPPQKPEREKREASEERKDEGKASVRRKHASKAHEEMLTFDYDKIRGNLSTVYYDQPSLLQLLRTRSPRLKEPARTPPAKPLLSSKPPRWQTLDPPRGYPMVGNETTEIDLSYLSPRTKVRVPRPETTEQSLRKLLSSPRARSREPVKPVQTIWPSAASIRGGGWSRWKTVTPRPTRTRRVRSSSSDRQMPSRCSLLKPTECSKSRSSATRDLPLERFKSDAFDWSKRSMLAATLGPAPGPVVSLEIPE